MDKTKIIVFRKGDRLDRHCNHFVYRGETIKVVNRYIYLRVVFTSSALQACNAITDKIRFATSSALAILALAGADSREGIIKLYRATITSVLLYAAPLWGFRYLEKMSNPVGFLQKVTMHTQEYAGIHSKTRIGLIPHFGGGS